MLLSVSQSSGFLPSMIMIAMVQFSRGIYSFPAKQLCHTVRARFGPVLKQTQSY
ncbi:hypothetical protein K470DRAFT_78419 [Piedraia hortae CBS 480.64]|uniref:Uncharacterized protein n=1 Tax=Piedraia hortae CBS 480.64 TaxID=1314780 RepID=A0A6A7BYE1_9PEZI|nr:hypothetical protein K470DRAFT_78419 [Piedraia hortae CBS 480.64]